MKPTVTEQPNGDWWIDCHNCGWHGVNLPFGVPGSGRQNAERWADAHACPRSTRRTGQPVNPINPDFIRLNIARSNRWHPGGLSDWSLSDWLCATGGELGEAMNAAKKLKRIEDGIANLSSDPVRHVIDAAEAKAMILDELADTFCYLVLTAARVTPLSPELLNQAIVDKFNAVSDRYGFPEKLEG